MPEDTSVGGVTWHSSEDDGGPDVGISVFLGNNRRLWCGEISRALYDECRGSDHFDGDGGWFLVLFTHRPLLLAKVGDKDQAKELMEFVASLARHVDFSAFNKKMHDLLA